MDYKALVSREFLQYIHTPLFYSKSTSSVSCLAIFRCGGIGIHSRGQADTNRNL